MDGSGIKGTGGDSPSQSLTTTTSSTATNNSTSTPNTNVRSVATPVTAMGSGWLPFQIPSKSLDERKRFEASGRRGKWILKDGKWVEAASSSEMVAAPPPTSVPFSELGPEMPQTYRQWKEKKMKGSSTFDEETQELLRKSKLRESGENPN